MSAETSDEHAGFRAIVERAPDPIFVHIDQRFAYMNPACCRLFGLASPDVLLGTPVLERIHPGYRARVAERMRRAYEQRKSVEDLLEQPFVRLDGSEVWVESKGEPIVYDGRPGALVFVRDVTERRRATAELERSHRILQQFVEHAPAIAMFDRDMRYIAVTRRYLEESGVGDRDLIGCSHYDVFPETPERWREIHRRCLLGATECCEEDPFRRSDGAPQWARWEIRPWREADGAIGGIALFSQVVTERRLAIERVRESERKFRDLFDKHAAVKLLIDPRTHTIIDANAAAAAYYGWSLERLRGMGLGEINPMDSYELAARITMVERRQARRFESQHLLADGSLRDVLVDTSIIEIGDQPVLHSIIHDVTDQKRAEREREALREQLAQAQKLETIGTLAGGVAHDFNNMLGVINGFAEIALDRAAPGDPLREELQAILDAGRRAADITRQLLAFARKQPVVPRVLDLNERVGALLGMLERLIGNDIELTWTPGEGVWPVRMDPSQVDQILTNLCANARNAIAGVGRIAIGTGNVALDAEYCRRHPGARPGDYAFLTVSDDGRGMDRETQSKVFEPFFTTRGRAEGTGLGLSTVYGIVMQNAGIIDVVSEPSRGSTFRICLPRRTGTPVATATAAAPAAAIGRGETILLVEDEPAILMLCRRMLASLHYVVLTASSPSEAMALAANHVGGIDLLITDVVMPERNGWDLARDLQARHPRLRVLFMSGHTLDASPGNEVMADDVDFIQKPFSQAELAGRVRRAFGDRDR